MELRHLRNFVAVEEALNFTKAAAQLRIAQPALSRQVQAYSRTSFRITPEDRPAPPRHLQARALAKGGPEPSSFVLHHLI